MAATAFSRGLGDGHLAHRAEDRFGRADRVQSPDDVGLRSVLRGLETELEQVAVDDGKAGPALQVFREGPPRRLFVDGGMDAHGHVSVVRSLGRRPFAGNKGSGFGQTTRPSWGIAAAGRIRPNPLLRNENCPVKANRSGLAQGAQGASDVTKYRRRRRK